MKCACAQHPRASAACLEELVAAMCEAYTAREQKEGKGSSHNGCENERLSKQHITAKAVGAVAM